MKKFLSIAAFIGLSLLAHAQEMNMMTFNIRYNNTGDSLNSWPYRKDLVANQILAERPAFLGVQEALHDQMLDLRERLKGYESIGGGRVDGATKGEYSAIFYDSLVLQRVKSGMFWLSQTPEVVGSLGWDAALTRMVTWAEFKHRKSGKTFYAFNTHFDHRGPEARRQSSLLLLKKVEEIAGKSPAVITGDFNAKPDEEPAKLLVDASNTLKLIDTRFVSRARPVGHTGTFNGFRSKDYSNVPIDYIFIKGKWKVVNHRTLDEMPGGKFVSDHFAIVTKLKL